MKHEAALDELCSSAAFLLEACFAQFAKFESIAQLQPANEVVSSDDSAGFVDCMDCRAPITLHIQGLLFTHEQEAAKRLRPWSHHDED